MIHCRVEIISTMELRLRRPCQRVHCFLVLASSRCPSSRLAESTLLTPNDWFDAQNIQHLPAVDPFSCKKTHDQCCTNSSCSLKKKFQCGATRFPHSAVLQHADQTCRTEPQCDATDKRHDSMVVCFFFDLQVHEMVQAYTQ